jgi:hypothetical protein
LAAKLALRAAKCALWLGQEDAAERWLAHSALAGSAVQSQAQEVVDQVAACHKVAAACEQDGAPGASVLDADGLAPPLLRSRIVIQHGAIFSMGHDDPCSMLQGACIMCAGASDAMICCIFELAPLHVRPCVRQHALGWTHLSPHHDPAMASMQAVRCPCSVSSRTRLARSPPRASHGRCRSPQAPPMT